MCVLKGNLSEGNFKKITIQQEYWWLIDNWLIPVENLIDQEYFTDVSMKILINPQSCDSICASLLCIPPLQYLKQILQQKWTKKCHCVDLFFLFLNKELQ